ncbi:MAG: hypothetical protein HKN47_27560 [Pirellulaceae bacterium]|nr:hypothetical protein [Pirellulaceae bacterium]
MDDSLQVRSIGRFLYTQNPFYLLSCGFILYGLQVAAAAVGDQYIRASFLTSSLGSYTVMMALTAVAVIRWGKVWQDARTILLVVVIGQVAYSVSVDELCLSDSRQAAWFLLSGAVGVVLVTEMILRWCRIGFPFWYRVPFYAILGVFYAGPLIAGHFRADNSEWSHSSSLLFSMSIGAALLLLTPAVRAGQRMATCSGTPWNWPLFPLSAFAILAVLAAVRSHAIWMSFGSLRGSVTFEPLLLLPIILAAAVLAIESAIVSMRREWLQFIMWVSPAALVCGASSFANSPQPFDAGLAIYGGSSMTVTLVLMVAFYFYTWVRGVPGSEHPIALALFGFALWGRVPSALQPFGLQPSFAAIAACAIYLVYCLIHNNSEWRWLTFATITGATMLLLGERHGRMGLAWGCTGAWILAGSMLIGAVFDSWLALQLRRLSAAALMTGGVALVSLDLFRHPINGGYLGLIAATIIAAVYLLFVRRSAWIYVTGLLMACVATLTFAPMLGMLSANATDHWQIKVGLLCFALGVVITSTKTGVYRRKWVALKQRDSVIRLTPGF